MGSATTYQRALDAELAEQIAELWRLVGTPAQREIARIDHLSRQAGRYIAPRLDHQSHGEA